MSSCVRCMRTIIFATIQSWTGWDEVGGDVEECLGFGGKSGVEGHSYADNLETCHMRNQGLRPRRLQLRHKFADGAQIVCRVSAEDRTRTPGYLAVTVVVREAVVADSRHVAISKPDSPSTSTMKAGVLGNPQDRQCRLASAAGRR
jgi:hypothetical protein